MEEQNSTQQNTQPSQPESHIPIENKNTHQAPMGPIVGVIIIVAVLAIGGLYYWGGQLNRAQNEMTREQMENDMKNAPTPEELRTQSSSDELEAIEADLEVSNFNQLDAEMAEIESEFNF